MRITIVTHGESGEDEPILRLETKSLDPIDHRDVLEEAMRLVEAEMEGELENEDERS